MATKLFVRSLAYSVTSEALGECFAQVGTVTSANVIMDRDSGQSKGFGFVEMADDAAAQEAIKQLDGRDLGGRSISVSVARPKEDRPARPAFNQRSRY